VPASSQEHALPRRRHNLSCCPGARSPGLPHRRCAECPFCTVVGLSELEPATAQNEASLLSSGLTGSFQDLSGAGSGRPGYGLVCGAVGW
jgi:hypothetical protein